MKTYLTLLFCAPLFLYVLGVLIIDAAPASEKPAVATTAVSSSPPHAGTDWSNVGIPSLVKTCAQGWAVGPLHEADTTHVEQLTEISE